MGPTISIYAIPPLISMLFLFSLAIVSFFSGHGKAQWKMLSMFSMLLGMATLFAFMAINNESGVSIKHLQIAPLFGMFSIYFAILYAFLLTGQSDYFTLMGKKVSAAGYFIIGLVIWAILLFILRETNWFIRNIKVISLFSYKVYYGPLFYVFLVIIVFGLGKILINLHRTFKQSDNKIFREYLFLNIIAFRIIYGSVLSLLFIFPLFGLSTQILVFFAFPIGVLIIYIAIMRYQFHQIDELNINLENKVKERTRELENTQALLVQSKTMASVGQLAAGIAHEINNPVGAVQSMQQSIYKSFQNTQKSLISQFPDIQNNSDFVKFIKVMHEGNRVTADGTKRIARIVKTIKNFANLDEADQQRFDVHEGLEDTIRLIKADSPAINIETHFSAVSPVIANPAKLNQVFWNVMQNSVQAINGAGKITVSTLQEHKQIIISFKDTGKGITQENLERIFEPGFTTKGVGVGTGLGLSICYKLVQEHNGTIDITSSPGKGTRVKISLPTAD